MKLFNRVAVITGGASGIGEATARLMVAEGARVVIVDVNDEKGNQLEKELNSKDQIALFVHTDVTIEEDVKSMIQKVVEHFGSLDVIFNSAGIGYNGPSIEMSFADWQRVISINLNSVFLCSKHAIKQMLQYGGGVVINSSSILGSVGQATKVAYSASKAGVTNLTRALALEYAKEGIRVVSVSPGYIDTPLLANINKETKDYLATLHPIGRFGKAEEVAKAVIFLASDDASFITGADLAIDGGYTAGK